MNCSRPSRQDTRGVILTEAIVALALVGLVLTAVSLLLTRHSRATDYFLNYRRAQLAASSCIERMRAGLVSVSSNTFEDGAGASYDVRVTEAEPAWQPLKRVAITARVVGKHGRMAQYRIKTYLAASAPAKGGAP